MFVNIGHLVKFPRRVPVSIFSKGFPSVFQGFSKGFQGFSNEILFRFGHIRLHRICVMIPEYIWHVENNHQVNMANCLSVLLVFRQIPNLISMRGCHDIFANISICIGPMSYRKYNFKNCLMFQSFFYASVQTTIELY